MYARFDCQIIIVVIIIKREDFIVLMFCEYLYIYLVGGSDRLTTRVRSVTRERDYCCSLDGRMYVGIVLCTVRRLRRLYFDRPQLATDQQPDNRKETPTTFNINIYLITTYFTQSSND
jgi:hypothetical protein